MQPAHVSAAINEEVGLERAGKGASFLGWGVTNQVTDSLSDALQFLTIRWMSLVRAGGTRKRAPGCFIGSQ
jgi:hypothetical protein